MIILRGVLTGVLIGLAMRALGWLTTPDRGRRHDPGGTTGSPHDPHWTPPIQTGESARMGNPQ